MKSKRGNTQGFTRSKAKGMQGRVRKLGLILAVNVVVLVACFEAAGLAYFAVRDGHFYYLARGDIVTARVAEFGTVLNRTDAARLRHRLEEGSSQIRLRLNSYYGYQHTANSRLSVDALPIPPGTAAGDCKYRVNVLCENGKVYFVTNNYGFDTVLDYPYRKESDDEFVIGIFGESVAEGFVVSAIRQMFDDVFAPAPQLRGKKVVLLPFAMEGFKQPQELETLAYFLSRGQRFDLVVNIDGVNPILQAMVNHNASIDESMPSWGQLSALVGLIDAGLQQTGNEASLDRYFWLGVQERILRRMARLPLAGPASLLDLGIRLAGRFEARALNAALEGTSRAMLDHPLFFLPETAGTTLDRALERSIAAWNESSFLMAQMLRGLGIPYLHVLQPNQYFSKKKFTDEENRIAISWGNGLAGQIHKYYPRMVAAGETLSKEGVDFVSAVDIFDDVGDTIYTDECCHFNVEGNLLLGKFIVAHLPPPREPF